MSKFYNILLQMSYKHLLEDIFDSHDTKANETIVNEFCDEL